MFQGAFVFEPKPGLYKALGILDFASLYPSIILANNICFTTLVTESEEQNPSDAVIDLPGARTARFTTQRRGLLPQVVQQFMDKRNELKKRMIGGQKKDAVLDSQQQGIKTICNSFYGVLGASNGFFGLRILAEAVTAYGREAVKKAQKFLEDRGLPVRMMDTDSCFFEIPESVSVSDTPDFCRQQAKDISEHLFGNKLTMQYERQLRPALVFKKKMYAGFDPDPNRPELVFKGISAKRRNVTPFTRETLQTTLRLLCEKGDIQQAFQYVKGRFRELTHNLSQIPLRDFALTCSIKHISEYKGTPSIGFRVNQKLPHPMSPGDRIEYVHFYDPGNPEKKTKKSKAIETVLPLELMMQQKTNYVVDVARILEEHHRELRQYFASVSNSTEFDNLYADTQHTIRTQRGCQDVGFEIVFLNLSG
jgi:DNA polymerase elongation subunit (family B)